MSFYSRVSAAIKAAADAAGDLRKLVLGTPGFFMTYPDIPPPDGDAVRQQRETGQLWSGQIIAAILEEIGVDLDARLGTLAPATRASLGGLSVAGVATGTIINASDFSILYDLRSGNYVHNGTTVILSSDGVRFWVASGTPVS